MTTVLGLLAAEHVSLCIDTNILIEFQPLASLPWRELTPAATQVRVIVPTKVGAEMDEHKFSSGRLRKRAAEFSDLVRRLERNNYAPINLCDSDPRVTFEFGPLFKSKDLDSEQFELTDPDNRVVAEVLKTSVDVPGLVFMADDGLAVRLAHHAGVPFIRPPASWRRPESTDERDNEIADLRRQLGPLPKLTLGFPLAQDDGRHVLNLPPTAICRNCVDRIVETVLAVDRETPRSLLEKRYPSAHTSSSFGGFYMPTPIGEVTADDLDTYRSEFDAYRTTVRLWASHLPSIIVKQGPIIPMYIDIGNEGDRAADKVHLQAELSGPFHFEPEDLFDKLLERVLAVPDEPAPYLLGTSLQEALRENARRVDAFYVQDEPERGGQTKMISWRCEELRQNSKFSLLTLVVADEPGARGALTIRGRGAEMAKGVSLTTPLRSVADPDTGAFHAYLRNRVELVPQRFRAPLLLELERPAPECTCETTASS